MRASIAALALLGLVLAGPAGRADPAAPAPTRHAEPDYVYVGMQDRDRPFLDYEGDGLVIQNLVRQAERGDPFELELVVIDLDPTRERYVAGTEVSERVKTRLRAKVVREGEARFRLQGAIEVRGPTRIQFVQMQRAGDADRFPELSFEAGRHAVAFDARVVGWLAP